jgi:hypothetical protein
MKIFNREKRERRESTFAFVCLFAFAVLIATMVGVAQQPPLSHAQDFSTDMYFEPPNEQLVKTRVSGAEALPLPGGLLDVKKLTIESFGTNGALEMTARAEQCTYDLHHGTASSPGHLEMISGDGAYRVSGDGFVFVWQTNAVSLTLSNHVHSVIQSGFLKL